MMNSRMVCLRESLSLVVLLGLLMGYAVAAPPDRVYPEGYSDTPMLPNSKWRVHDIERPQPRVVTPGEFSLGATAPSAPVHPGYTFTGWDKDFSNVTSNMTVTAVYEQNCSQFTVENKDPGTGTGPGAGTVDVYYNGSFVTNLAPGEDVDIPYVAGVDTVQCEAIPSAQSKFNKWNEVSTNKTDNPRDFAIPVTDDPAVVSVHPQWFEKDKYLIDTTVTNGTIDPDVYVYEGDDVTINYTAETGYHLVSVTVDGADKTASNPNSYTFTNVQVNHTVSVVYAIDTFTITPSVTGGTIDPNTPVTVNYGEDQAFTFTPDTGYHLTSVIVDAGTADETNVTSSVVDNGDGTYTYTFADVSANHSIAVLFEIDTFTITTSVTNGTIDPSTTVNYGDDITISYSANTGYHLQKVKVDGVNLDIATYPNSYTFSDVQDNHTIEVIYRIDKFLIDTTVTNGTIDPVDPMVSYGHNKTITYTPDIGYHLASVTVDGIDMDILTYPDSYKFINVTDNHTITVVYAINTYTVTYDANGGTGSQSDPNSPYDYNTAVTALGLGTIERTGHLFLGWNTKADGTGVPYAVGDAFLIRADRTFYAQWSIETYTVTYNANGGTGSQTDPNSPYDYGTEVTALGLGTIEKTGYMFEGWNTQADGGGVPYAIGDMFIISADRVFYAMWSDPLVYDITYNLDGGTNDPANPVDYTVEDDTITLADPTKDGYTFLGWTPTDNIPAGSTGDKEFTATWEINTYDIATSVTSGTIDPGVTVDYGTDVTINYSGSTGYHLSSVTVDGSPVDIGTYPDSYTFSAVDADHTIDVVYGINTYRVEFVDFDGTSLNVQWVHVGNGATAPGAPTRAGFTFAGWDKAFGNITGPLTVTALYTPIPAAPAAAPTPTPSPTVIPQASTPAAAPSVEPTPAPTPEVIEEQLPEAAPGIAWALLNLILAVAGAIMMIVLIVGYFARRKNDDRYNVKRRGAARIISLIPGIGGIIAFLLTEPWWVSSIVFTDVWTWLMIVIFAAQVVIAVLARKKREEKDNGSTPAQA